MSSLPTGSSENSDTMSLQIRYRNPEVLGAGNFDAEPGGVSQELHVPVASNATYADEELWTRNKDLIGELYRKHNLPEVMKIMREEHGLKATRRMYITRLERWGFATKNKRPSQRSQKAIKTSKVTEGQKSSSSLSQSVSAQRRDSSSWGIVGPRHRRATRMLRGEEPVHVGLEVPILNKDRNVMWAITSYCKGCRDSGAWIVDENLICRNVNSGLDTNQLNAFTNYSFHSLDLLMRDVSSEDAEKSLVAAMDTLEGLLRAEIPGLFMVIMEVVAAFNRIDKYAVISKSIIKYVASMASIVLGELHPITVASTTMSNLDTRDWNELIRILYEVTIDACDIIFGPFCSGCMIMRRCYRDHLAKTSGPEAVLIATRKNLVACEAEFGVPHAYTNDRRVDLINDLVDACLYEEAIELGQEALRYCNSMSQQSDVLWALGRARAEYSLTDFCEQIPKRILIDQARQDFKEAISLREVECSVNDAQVIRYLGCLQDYLFKWGELTEAKEMETDLSSRRSAVVEIL